MTRDDELMPDGVPRSLDELNDLAVSMLRPAMRSSIVLTEDRPPMPSLAPDATC